jgi:hypothetical protein
MPDNFMVLHGLRQKSLKNYDIQQQSAWSYDGNPNPPHNKWPPLPYSPIYKHWVTATKVKKSGKSRTCLSKLSETPSMWGNAMQPCSQDMKSVQFLDYHLLLFTYWERLLNLAQKKVSVIPYLVSKTHWQAIMLSNFCTLLWTLPGPGYFIPSVPHSLSLCLSIY